MDGQRGWALHATRLLHWLALLSREVREMGGRRSWEFDRAFQFHSASGVVRLLLEFLEKEAGNDGWMDEA